MTSGESISDHSYLIRARETSIHIGLVVLLVATCLLFLKPFIAVLAWGLIIAIACYPRYCWLRKLLGGRGGLASIIFTGILITVLIIPLVMLAHTLIEGSHTLAARLQSGALNIPAPPPKVATWPIIGKPLSDLWTLASTNLSGALELLAPQFKGAATKVLAGAAAVGLGVLQFFLALLIAGLLLARSSEGVRVSRKFATRLFSDKAEEMETLAVATVRSVTSGILGVALIQSVLAGLGFLVVGLPGAGLWALIFLIAALLQVGGPALIPVVIYVFATMNTTKAVVFLVWCVFVGLMDNVLKPLLLGRGLPVPVVVVFLGVLGGFLAMGIIGLFVGPIVLSVGYKLFLAWLD